MMPSTAARSMATTSSPVMVVLPADSAPARRNAVPQMGPEVPPMRPVMVTATFFRKVPTSLRSKSSKPASTCSNPLAME